MTAETGNEGDGVKVWLAWHGSWDNRYLVGVYGSALAALAALAAANEDECRRTEELNEGGRYDFEPEITEASPASIQEVEVLL